MSPKRTKKVKLSSKGQINPDSLMTCQNPHSSEEDEQVAKGKFNENSASGQIHKMELSCIEEKIVKANVDEMKSKYLFCQKQGQAKHNFQGFQVRSKKL
mmetsp:Transcript_21495/g.24352  ORF Transcript_21495/g.24352 Transcript_21495/m.24352 type:complete len:99 (-) Transcript_21495:58-354(-)